MEKLCELLTIVVPVKNEERNLDACLTNVAGFSHVVVVDSGSTDSTREIFDRHQAEARSRGVEWSWVDFRWNGHFPKKRNWLLSNYTFKTPWVLFLDADERITSAFIAEASAVLARETPVADLTGRFDAYICYYDNWFVDRLLRHGDVMHKTAILRVGAGGYERIEEDHWSHLDMEIHEHLQVPGRIGVITSRLEHYDRRSLESYYRKHDEYAAWEANRYRALKGDYSQLTGRQRVKYALLDSVFFAPLYFLATYVAMGGFLDGSAGFRFACGKFRYFRSIARRLREAPSAQLPVILPETSADITVIILMRNERMHIRRCLERLVPLRPRRVVVIDSPSDDGSDRIARDSAAELGLDLELVVHPWPGLQSLQFNWALDNLNITTAWVLRVDADEYLTPFGVTWLRTNLPSVNPETMALALRLERRFLGREIRHATNGIRMVRLFRAGRGRYSESQMDERIVADGATEEVPVTFYDDNLHALAWWREKHLGYARREALQAIDRTFVDPRKVQYYRYPPYLRAVLYFGVRYILQGGFLDGRVGWSWNFWQGLWYRWQVDREIGRLKRAARRTVLTQ